MAALWDTTRSEFAEVIAAQRRTGDAVLSGVALTPSSSPTTTGVPRQNKLPKWPPRSICAGFWSWCGGRSTCRSPRDWTPRSARGRLGPREVVVMRMDGRLGPHAESVVVPLLAACRW